MTTVTRATPALIRRPRRARVLLSGVVGLTVLVAACGSETTDPASNPVSTLPAPAESPPATPAPPTTDVPPDTTVPSSEGAVPSLDGVRSATVRIEAQGTFVDPEFGAYEAAGSGSGFVIDASGIAVTNNHVVVGAGLLQVHVPGEDRPRNAQVLGVSECSDLAVIQIDGGGLPYLEWFEGDATPGLDVYAAGYPLGDPEFTLTRGIVAKARAFGDTPWASIDHVIEHDANIQPGNSGGPLVDPDGRVVGVDYASANFTNQSQFFAIAAGEARTIVERLERGEDVDSIGINGQAVVADDGSLSGVWVAGVASGSTADLAGVRPGDVITRLEGISLATDGTLRDYCDVLRSHAPDAHLAVEVLRYDTSEVLVGRLNGPPLETAFSFADTFGDTTDGPGSDQAGGDQSGGAYAEYVSVVDDTGTISVTVPAEWADVDGSPIELAEGVSSASIVAAPDRQGFATTWAVPGMEFIADPVLLEFGPEQMLDLVAPVDCVSEGRGDYDDGSFAGLYEVFASCGGSTTSYYVVATVSADGGYGVLVTVQVVSDADLEALDVVLRTFDLAR